MLLLEESFLESKAQIDKFERFDKISLWGKVFHVTESTGKR